MLFLNINCNTFSINFKSDQCLVRGKKAFILKNMLSNMMPCLRVKFSNKAEKIMFEMYLLVYLNITEYNYIFKSCNYSKFCKQSIIMEL